MPKVTCITIRDAVQQFMGHARHKTIRRVHNSFRITLTENDNKNGNIRLLKGLCNELKNAFYADYDYYRVSKKSKSKPSKKRKRGDGGKERGKRVDEELSRYVLDQVERKTYHLYTIKCIRALKHWGYQPSTCQVNIYDEDIGIATAIDCLVLNRKKEMVLLEIKTGFEGYHDESTHFMTKPLTGIANTPKNQHFLQLLFMCIMLDKKYGISLYERAYVIRICDAGVYRYKLPDWATEKRDIMYQMFIDRAKRVKEHDLFIQSKRISNEC